MRSHDTARQLALFTAEAASGEAVMPAVADPPSASDPDDEDPAGAATWTAEEVGQLRQVLLTQTLKTIRDGRSATGTINECWEWVVAEGDADGFSFRSCAIESGCDPDELRQRLNEAIRRDRSARAPHRG